MTSFDLTEEQQMIVDAVKRFATIDMRAVFRESDEEGQIPEDIIRKGWEMGLIPGGIPDAYMGFADEHSAVTGVLFAEELAWGDLSIALHLLSPGLVGLDHLGVHARVVPGHRDVGLDQLDRSIRERRGVWCGRSQRRSPALGPQGVAGCRCVNVHARHSQRHLLSHAVG